MAVQDRVLRGFLTLLLGTAVFFEWNGHAKVDGSELGMGRHVDLVLGQASAAAQG